MEITVLTWDVSSTIRCFLLGKGASAQAMRYPGKTGSTVAANMLRHRFTLEAQYYQNGLEFLDRYAFVPRFVPETFSGEGSQQ